MGRSHSGQLLVTVNHAPHGFVGSNPTRPTKKIFDFGFLILDLF